MNLKYTVIEKEDEVMVSDDKVRPTCDDNYTAVRLDPYGLWKITTKNGPVPAKLSGRYTSPMEVDKAIKSYLQTRDRVIPEVGSDIFEVKEDGDSTPQKSNRNRPTRA